MSHITTATASEEHKLGRASARWFLPVQDWKRSELARTLFRKQLVHRALGGSTPSASAKPVTNYFARVAQ